MTVGPSKGPHHQSPSESDGSQDTDGAGYGPADAGRLLPPPTDPLKLARVFVEYLYAGGYHLRHHANTFYSFDGRCWPEAEKNRIDSQIYDFTEDAVYEKMVDGEITLEPWRPTRNKVGNVLDALKAIGYLDGSIRSPAWLEDTQVPANEVIVVDNGLLHVPTRTLLDHTPSFWAHNALPYAYDPDAPPPARWMRFLGELWGDDTETIATLQEVFGYCLTVDTSQQKLFWLIGPKRTGKGTIARVLSGLLGRHNVAGPTMAGMVNEFGLAPLVDKPLAVISDARIGTRSDQSIVVERLLSISGEDSLSINRKYRDHWYGKLPTRFLVLSNEMPKLLDSSGALASRFIVMMLRTSFYGREDPTLTEALLSEATGILNWGLDGLDRLNGRGHFQQPEASREAIRQIEDMSSPVSAFVRDNCRLDPQGTTPKVALYEKWGVWCEANGYKRTASNTFARDLRAAYPEIREVRPRDHDVRARLWSGITIDRDKNEATVATDVDRLDHLDHLDRDHAPRPGAPPDDADEYQPGPSGPGYSQLSFDSLADNLASEALLGELGEWEPCVVCGEAGEMTTFVQDPTSPMHAGCAPSHWRRHHDPDAS